MKTTLKGGSVLKTVEFEARGIDQYGDCVTVNHYETKNEAIAAGASMMVGEIVAVVIEKHTAYYPAHLAPSGKEPDTYKREAVAGSRVALAEGGWIETEETP